MTQGSTIGFCKHKFTIYHNKKPRKKTVIWHGHTKKAWGFLFTKADSLLDILYSPELHCYVCNLCPESLNI